MSKVIDSFLVALGFEVDEQSEKEAGDSMDRLRGNALKIGAALAAAFASGTYAAKRTAERIDEVTNAARLLSDVGVNYVDQLGHAFTLAGGDASEAVSTLEQFEELLTDLRTGQNLEIFEELARLQIPNDFLMDAETSVDLLNRLVGLMPQLEPRQQVALANVMGLSEGAELFTRAGQAQVDQWMARAAQLAEITGQMSRDSAELVDAWHDVGRATEGVMRQFTGGAAQDMTETLNGWADAMARFRENAQIGGEVFGDIFKALSPAPLDDDDSMITRGLRQATGWPLIMSGYESVRDWFKEMAVNPNAVPLNPAIPYPLIDIPGGTSSTKNIRIDRLEMNIEGSRDPEEVSSRVLDKLNQSAEIAEQSERSPVEG